MPACWFSSARTLTKIWYTCWNIRPTTCSVFIIAKSWHWPSSSIQLIARGSKWAYSKPHNFNTIIITLYLFTQQQRWDKKRFDSGNVDKWYTSSFCLCKRYAGNRQSVSYRQWNRWSEITVIFIYRRGLFSVSRFYEPKIWFECDICRLPVQVHRCDQRQFTTIVSDIIKMHHIPVWQWQWNMNRAFWLRNGRFSIARKQTNNTKYEENPNRIE